MVEIALCDDDPAMTGYLETAIQASGPLLGEPLHIQIFNQGAALLAALNQNVPFEIIFLDIELGDTTGIAVAEQIRKDSGHRSDETPVLIFVSAHESYCKQLFQFDTTAFLSKPIDEAEVASLLLRAYKKVRNPLQVFVYHIKDEVCYLPLADILFFESRAHKIEIVTRAAVRTFYGKLDAVEAQLEHPGFVRAHHSILINLDNVERFEKGSLYLPGGRIVSLSRSRQKEACHKIMSYIKGGKP
jgi:DNA-binding LytR/AlgR family response regulator